MADWNPFAVLNDDADYGSGSDTDHPSPPTISKSTTLTVMEFPRLTNDSGGGRLFQRLANYANVAHTGRYVAHYYPQHASANDYLTGDAGEGFVSTLSTKMIPSDYLLPLLLQYPRPVPVSIKERQLELDLLPFVYIDDHYLMTAPADEYAVWRQLAPATSVQKPLYWRRKLYGRLGRFPIRSTSQFKTLLNTIDDLTSSLGRPMETAMILDASPGYGELFLAAVASHLHYHGVQPHDIKRQLIDRMNRELRVDDSEFKLYETTILETTLPKETYELIYYQPTLDPGDQRWQLTVERELEQLWPALKPNGFLLVALGDSRQLNAAAYTNRLIERELYYSSFYGTIGVFRLGDTKAAPVWVWSKEPTGQVKRWRDRVVVLTDWHTVYE